MIQSWDTEALEIDELKTPGVPWYLFCLPQEKGCRNIVHVTFKQ